VPVLLSEKAFSCVNRSLPAGGAPCTNKEWTCVPGTVGGEIHAMPVPGGLNWGRGSTRKNFNECIKWVGQ